MQLLNTGSVLYSFRYPRVVLLNASDVHNHFGAYCRQHNSDTVLYRIFLTNHSVYKCSVLYC